VASARLHTAGESIFARYGALADAYKAINLAQGSPGFDPPALVIDAVERACRDGKNQYSPPAGMRALREALAAHAERFYRMPVDPETMVTVTAGATAGIFAVVTSYIGHGDEVVAFDPCYESYEPAVRLSGGILRRVRLYAPDADHATWWFSPDELAAIVNDRTKLVLLNTPHNPTGKVFTADELAQIAELTAACGALIACDEVYEHLVYAPAMHVRMATLPGLAERTITIGSAGKTFSATGWRVGWLISSPALQARLRTTHQTMVYSAPAPLQMAIAEGLAQPDACFDTVGAEYAARRELLVSILAEAGMRPYRIEGSFFGIVDIARLGFDDDAEFCAFLTMEIGVTPLPCSAFFDPERADAKRFARFAFCRRLDVLAEAGRRLRDFSPRTLIC